jgi:hypothetical protein
MIPKAAKFCFIPILLLIGLIYLHSTLPSALNDPDRFYHFAVSRYMVDTGELFPKEYPAVDDLGWGIYYPDKEFLYHQFTRLGYWVAADEGVIYITLFLSSLSLLLLYFHSIKNMPIWIGLPCVIFFFCSPSLLYRMMMVRPHVLAIFAFLGILISATQRSRRWLFLFGLLFSLSYHAFYVPLICLGMGAGLSFLAWFKDTRKEELKFFGWGALGLLVGLVINPYFPSNVIGSWQIALIPSLMEGKLSNAGFGVELKALPANEFIRRILPQLMVLFWATFQLGKWQTYSAETKKKFLFLYACSIFTFALACLNRRGAEYFLPAVVVLLLFLLHKTVEWKRVQRICWSVFVVFLSLHSLKYYFDERTVAVFPLGPASLEAAETLPQTPVKVYNCDWDRSPFIIYKRPQAKVVDILDPSLIFFFNPAVYEIRQQIRDGRVGDTRGLLMDQFKADYVFCVNPAMSATFLRDPHFEPIFPKAKDTNDSRNMYPYVFRILPEKNDRFVNSMDVSFYALRPLKEFRNIRREEAKSASESLRLEKSNFVNLDGIWRKTNKPTDLAEEQALCSLVTPNKDEMMRLRGANFIGLGGGRNLRLWRNGKELFESGSGYGRSAMIQVLVPLDPPLSVTDSIEVMSCSSNKGSYWGVALSFWRFEELAKICAEKGMSTGNLDRPYEWKYTGILQETCLGPVARLTLEKKYQPPRIFP